MHGEAVVAQKTVLGGDFSKLPNRLVVDRGLGHDPRFARLLRRIGIPRLSYFL